MIDAHPATALELVSQAQAFVLQTCRELQIAEHVERLEVEIGLLRNRPPLLMTLAPEGFVVLAAWYEGVVTRNLRTDYIELTCDVGVRGVQLRLRTTHFANNPPDLTGLVTVNAGCPMCGTVR